MNRHLRGGDRKRLRDLFGGGDLIERHLLVGQFSLLSGRSS
jgi:hypothetical protein